MIYCEVYTMAEIRRKIAAYQELFQRAPLVALTGTWTDEGGDAVFFDSHPSSPATIKRSHIEATVDGDQAALRPTKLSGIRLG